MRTTIHFNSGSLIPYILWPWSISCVSVKKFKVRSKKIYPTIMLVLALFCSWWKTDDQMTSLEKTQLYAHLGRTRTKLWGVTFQRSYSSVLKKHFSTQLRKTRPKGLVFSQTVSKKSYPNLKIGLSKFRCKVFSLVSLVKKHYKLGFPVQISVRKIAIIFTFNLLC